MAKHGMFDTRIYNTWAHMKQRCYNTKNASYKDYGGKGIKVCEEWQDFIPFYNWSMKNGYNDTLTIDRIDNNKDYSPDNCRWATIEQQNNNKSDTILIQYNGKIQSVAKWSQELNIKYSTLMSRINKGIPLDEAFNTKSFKKIHYVTYQGETHTVKEWSKILGIKQCTLSWRLFRAKWSIEKAFTYK